MTEPTKGGTFGNRDGSSEVFSRMSVRLNFGSAATNGTKKPEATVKGSFRGQVSNLRQQQQQQQPVSIFYISDGRYKSESVPGELITILLLVVACLLFDLEALVVVQSQNWHFVINKSLVLFPHDFKDLFYYWHLNRVKISTEWTSWCSSW